MAGNFCFKNPFKGQNAVKMKCLRVPVLICDNNPVLEAADLKIANLKN